VAVLFDVTVGRVEQPWTVAASGLSVVVRLTPRGGRDSIDGIAQRADGQYVLKARVRAAATGGEANDALIALLADSAGVPPRDVALVSGATARIKRLTIAGHGPTLAAALEKISGV
jgi:uncharacterized protein YggU (UPF0235/DUF167 family)